MKQNFLKQRAMDIVLVLLQFGLLLVIIISPSMGTVNYAQLVRILEPLLFTIGVAIGLLGISGLRRSLSVFPTPTNTATLVTDGIYKYIRHPMYTGIILVTVAITLYKPSVLGLVLFTSLFIVLIIKSSYEEKLLMKKFVGYKQYKLRTGRFFIKL